MITLIVVHSNSDGLTTKVVKVEDDSSAGWVGTFGNLEEDDMEDGRLQNLVDFLGFDYDNDVDNLQIDEMPTEREIQTFSL
jgi:hypothetical protein